MRDAPFCILENSNIRKTVFTRVASPGPKKGGWCPKVERPQRLAVGFEGCVVGEHLAEEVVYLQVF